MTENEASQWRVQITFDAKNGLLHVRGNVPPLQSLALLVAGEHQLAASSLGTPVPAEKSGGGTAVSKKVPGLGGLAVKQVA